MYFKHNILILLICVIILFISCKKAPFCKCKYGYNEEKHYSIFPTIKGFTTLEEKQTFIVRDEMEYAQLFNPDGNTNLPHIDFSNNFLVGVELINYCNEATIKEKESVCVNDTQNKLYYSIKHKQTGKWCNLELFSSHYYKYKAILLDRKYINYEIEIKYDVKKQ